MEINLSAAERSLLRILCDCDGYVACDGKDRPVAHSLEKKGLADWKGTSWGSSFWGKTEKGIELNKTFSYPSPFSI